MNSVFSAAKLSQQVGVDGFNNAGKRFRWAFVLSLACRYDHLALMLLLGTKETIEPLHRIAP